MIAKFLSRAGFALACCSTALLRRVRGPRSRFSAEYVFGDSLSDVGNVYLGVGGLEPASPYVNGQFSNGPVWVQDLAARLGLPALTPSLAGGTDYAFGGATTGLPPRTIRRSPISSNRWACSFRAPRSAPSSALYTFSIGANDLFAILPGSTPISRQQEAAASRRGSGGGGGSRSTLAAAGAKDLVLFDVPDLGLTPAN